LAQRWALSARAARDLRRIRQWIAKDSGAVRAKAVIDRLERAFDMLAEHPLAGRAVEELGKGLRSFAVRPYLVFYRVQAARIVIVRVLDGRRDVPRAIRESAD